MRTEPTNRFITASADMPSGAVFSSNNFGDFEIIKYTNARSVLIRFLETGYTTKTQSNNVRTGTVKDYLAPSVCGVGCIGEGEFKATKNRKHTKAYAVWLAMMNRCYSKRKQEIHPTYIGCSVAQLWHNFQNFAKWYYDNYIPEYQIDKDIKVEGNKIYSPQTCLFVSCADNTEKASAKTFKFISPNGESVEIYNLRKFSDDNNLSCQCMSDVNRGKREHHRGWKSACATN